MMFSIPYKRVGRHLHSPSLFPLPEPFLPKTFRPVCIEDILMKFFAGHFKQFIASVFGTLVLASSAHAATLLTNGSFESPIVPVGNFSSFPVGSSAITGWTVVGPAGTSVSPVSGTFAQNGVAFIAQDGAQWLDLTGFNINSTEGVSQTVATTVGNLYQLSFFVGNTTGGGIFGTTSTVNVSLNGVQSFSDINSTVSPVAQNWQQFTHTFVATSASTTLALLNGDPVSDNNNGLDNVVLLDLGPAVGAIPEPDTYAMLLGGLSLLGFMLRRRKKNVVAQRFSTAYTSPALADFRCVGYRLSGC